MTNVIISVLLVCIILILFIQNKKVSTQDEFLINLAILDHVIDDYIAIVYSTKIKNLGMLYNIDPESKVNAIKSYEKKVNETIAESTKEIIELLSKSTIKYLKIRFSDKSIALHITNKLRNS